jgi:FixJ family two-component response regulator
MTPMSGPALVIAIVDDEDCVRKALERLLRTAGFKIAFFDSGEEFLESLEIRRPDCVILDLHLRGLSGLEVLQCLSGNRIRIPCVIMTGRDEPETGEQVLASGADGYLTKPFDQCALLKIICAAVQATNKDASQYRERSLRSPRQTNRTSGSGELHSTKRECRERSGRIKSVKVREEVFGSVDE